jgi:uncharacterized membrane protein YkvA (DUF1232 family)
MYWKGSLKRKRRMFDLKKRLNEIKLMIPTLYFAMKHKDTPLLPKILAAFTVAYALSPIDLIPDFIPFIGYLDDALILPVLATLTIKFIPKPVMEECKILAQNVWDQENKNKWIYALPILFIYILVILWIISLIFS